MGINSPNMATHSKKFDLNARILDSETDFQFSDLPFNINGEYTLIIDEEKYLLSMSNCQSIAVPINYHKTNFKMTPISNIDSILITDTSLPNCSMITEFKCSKNSSLCYKRKHYPGSSFESAIALCVNKSYIYFKPMNPDYEMQVEITGKFLNNSPCTSQRPSNLAVYCASLDPTSCKTNKACTHDCIWAECQVQDGRNTPFITTHGACVPYNSSRDRLQSICESQYLFFQTPLEYQNIIFDTCPEGLRDSPDEFEKFYMVIYVIIGIIVVFLLSSIYYKYQLDIHKVPPFQPPKYCPDRFFPRVTCQTSANENEEEIELGQYRSPG